MVVAGKSYYFSQGATFDDEKSRVYRYRLWRRWLPGAPYVCWIMLNPSTADERVLDPTLRRCERYTEAWGFAGFDVVNLFAFRATDPDDMMAAPDPVGGARNDCAIVQAAKAASLVVCAWGNGGTYRGRDREVRALLRQVSTQITHLKMTGEGQPGHPLYLPKTLEPQRWSLV